MDQLQDSGQAGTLSQIEITPAMVEAGVQELYENFRLGGEYADLVQGIFITMAMLEPTLSQSMPSASGIQGSLR